MTTSPQSPDEFPDEVLDRVQFQAQERVGGQVRALWHATGDLGLVLKQVALLRASSVEGRQVFVYSGYVGSRQA